MKKTASFRDYIDCPFCREKFHKTINEIPKSLITMQMIDASNSTVSNEHRSSIKSTDINITSNSGAESNPNQNTSNGWNATNYLRNIFNEIDKNRDGSITAQELQEILRLTQAGLDFNIKTVKMIMSSYDRNGDQEISFEEFYDLYQALNDEYESFLLMDSDGSGSIETEELSNALRAKGYTFSNGFYNYIVQRICLRTGQNGILFDDYIRVASKFDYLCKFYYRHYYPKFLSLEEFLKSKFFEDF